MKVKTSKLKGIALDWAMTMIVKPEACEFGVEDWLGQRRRTVKNGEYVYRWHQSWAQSGHFLSGARISRTIDHSGLWVAYWTDGYTEGDEGLKWMQCDQSELIAGLRCYIAKTLGVEVDVPEELLI